MKSPLESYEKAWERRVRSESVSEDSLWEAFREDGVDLEEYFDDQAEAVEAREFFRAAWVRGDDPRAVRRAVKKRARRMFLSLFTGTFRFVRSGYIPAWLREPSNIDLIAWSPDLDHKEILLRPLPDSDAVQFLARAIEHSRKSSSDPAEDSMDAWIELGDSPNGVVAMVGPHAVAIGNVSSKEWAILKSAAATGKRAKGTLYLSRSTDLPAAILAWLPRE